MTRYHGITTNTYNRFIIDSGAVYTGFTDIDAPGTLLGATKGGSSFSLEQEIKDMEVDGARGPVKGSRRIVNVKASLTVNFIEHTLTNLKRLIVGSTSALFDVSWDQITRGLAISGTDFLSSVAIVGQVSGNANAMGILLTDVIVDSNFEMAFEDKEEGVVSATFTAHFDPADLEAKTDTEPWSLIWPQDA